MKVLIVSRYCAPPSFHGSAQHVQLFAKELAQHGHEVRVISGEQTSGVLGIDGYRIEKVALKRCHRGLFNILDGRLPTGEFRHLAEKVFDQWEPDVLHVGVFMRMSDFVLEAAVRRIPISMMIHDYSMICLKKYFQNSDGGVCDRAERYKCIDCMKSSLGPKMRLANGIFSSLKGLQSVVGRSNILNFHLREAVYEAFDYMERIRSAVNRFIIQTPFSARFLVASGVEKARCIFIQQYIGEEKLMPYPKPSGNPGIDRMVRLGYIGRVSREKGLSILRHALLILEESNTEFELWILTGGTDLKEVTHLFGLEEIEKGRVKLFRNLTCASLAKVVAEIDVIVIPSVCQEIGPRTLLESLAQGVPAIVSDTVGHRHLIKAGVNGEIFPTGDAFALAKILFRLIKNPGILRDWSRCLPILPDKDQWYSSLFGVHEELLGNIK